MNTRWFSLSIRMLFGLIAVVAGAFMSLGSAFADERKPEPHVQQVAEEAADATAPIHVATSDAPPATRLSARSCRAATSTALIKYKTFDTLAHDGGDWRLRHGEFSLDGTTWTRFDSKRFGFDPRAGDICNPQWVNWTVGRYVNGIFTGEVKTVRDSLPSFDAASQETWKSFDYPMDWSSSWFLKAGKPETIQPSARASQPARLRRLRRSPSASRASTGPSRSPSPTAKSRRG